MADRLVKFIWLESKSQLPGRLDPDAIYYIADEALIIIDHGNGAVEFGGSQSVNTLDGDETDKSPTVHAVKQALAKIDKGLYRGTFSTAADLAAAYPTDKAGAYAIVLATGTTWVWSGAEWTDTGKEPEQTPVIDNLTTPDADKALSANQGVVIAKQLEKKTEGLVLALTIPNTGWIEDEQDTTGYPYYIDIHDTRIKKSMIPDLIFGVSVINTASQAGICASCDTLDGALRIYSRGIPTASMNARLLLLTTISGEVDPTGETVTPDEIDEYTDPENMFPD